MLDASVSNKEKFVQIYNADIIVINLEGWSLVAIIDGKVDCTWELSGTIKPGEAKTAGDDKNRDFTPDFINDGWHPGDNKWNGSNDGILLYHNDKLIDNAYGTDFDWSDGLMVRNENAGNATSVFFENEWTVYSESFDYRYHNCELPIIDLGPGYWSELTANYARGASYNIIGDVYVDSNTPGECYSIYIQRGNTLNIQAQKGLTIYKNLNNYSTNAAFSIESDANGPGSVIIYGASDNGTMEQYFEDTRLKTWQFVSSPVKNAKSAIFENDYLMYYYEPQQRYVRITPTDLSLQVGRGYTVLKAQDKTEKYEGTFNSGEIKIPTLTNTLEAPYSTDAFSGWNLIGNPYPSYIDWDKVIIPSKMQGQVSVWVVTNQDGEYISDWKVWVKGFGDREAHFIAPGTSFFVFSNYTENLVFDSSIQTHNPLISSTKSTTEIETPTQTMEISVSGNNAKSSYFFRFLPEATYGFDSKIDAFKMLSESAKMPQLYNRIGEVVLAANSIPYPAETDTLHLYFQVGVAGKYQLSFEGIKQFDSQQAFYLLDKVSGETFNLREDAIVNFTYQESDPENRFDLLFGLINSTHDYTLSENDISIYQASGKIFIHSRLPQTQNKRVEIRNLLGQLVYSSTQTEAFKNGKSINLPEATYIVSVYNNSAVYSQKIAYFN